LDRKEQPGRNNSPKENKTEIIRGMTNCRGQGDDLEIGGSAIRKQKEENIETIRNEEGCSIRGESVAIGNGKVRKERSNSTAQKTLNNPNAKRKSLEPNLQKTHISWGETRRTEETMKKERVPVSDKKTATPGRKGKRNGAKGRIQRTCQGGTGPIS